MVTKELKKNPFAQIIDAERLKNEIAAEKTVEGAKLLLANNVNEEREVLKTIGLDTHIVTIERKQEALLVKNKYKSIFEKEVFSISEIEKIAVKYRLHFRNTKLYRGNVPNDIGIQVNKFWKKHNLDSNQYIDGGKFFILAPPSMFKDYVTSLEKLKAFTKDVTAEKQNYKEWVESQKDPLLFYQIDAQNYILIESWGSTFTPFRRLLGILTTPMSLKILSGLFIALFGVFLPIFLVIKLFTSSPVMDYLVAEMGNIPGTILFILSLTAYIIFGFLFCCKIWLYIICAIFDIRDSNQSNRYSDSYANFSWSIKQLNIKNTWNKPRNQ